MKLALAMICKGSDEEADLLSRCLASIRPYVDGAFITITQPNERVEEVCKTFDCVTSAYEWDHDFSKARNFNFFQVPKEFTHILWVDADDILEGVEALKGFIESHPEADVYSMNYLYAFDEFNNPVVVHIKTQVVKNDGCVSWADSELHEDFKENRATKAYFIEDIRRIHLSNDERFMSAKGRNLEISLLQVKSKPEEPRSYWNVGNSMVGIGRSAEAIPYFEKFLEMSMSDEEKYIVRLRLAECYWNTKDKKKAFENVQFAIGLRPSYPDAYHLAGTFFMEADKPEQAREHIMLGLTKKPPYRTIIAYNPREYDYVPLMKLCKVYFSLNLPVEALVCAEACQKIYPEAHNIKGTIELLKKEVKRYNKLMKFVEKLKKIEDKEKLKEAIDNAPDDIRQHPAIVNLRNVHFIKLASSGKDLVIFCGYTQEVWNPETIKKSGIGGSEEAVFWLSNLLAGKGWNVTVYNNCGHTERRFSWYDEVKDDQVGVTYKPFWAWNYRDKQDVVVLWRTPRPADWEINAPKVIVDLHDVVPQDEFNELRLKRITKVLVKSKAQRDLFPSIPDEKIEIIPNGIDAEAFSSAVERDPLLLVNTSSPDRSLNALCDLFSEVKKVVPEAKCIWAYGWGVFDSAHSDNLKMMAWKNEVIKKMEAVGIEALGRITHEQVRDLYLRASIFAYPSEFYEIDCISLTKAMASGAVPVTTDFSAMGEKVKEPGVFVHSKKDQTNWCSDDKGDFGLEGEEERRQWIEGVVKLLQKCPTEEERAKMRTWASDNYDWKLIANKWNEILT